MHDPHVMGGKPCLRGLRSHVAVVVGLIAGGRSCDEILGAYPFLEEDDIPLALSYAELRSQETGAALPN